MNALTLTWNGWKKSPGQLALTVAVSAATVWLNVAAFTAFRTVQQWHIPFAQPDRVVSLSGYASGPLAEELLPSSKVERLHSEWREASGVAGYTERDVVAAGFDGVERHASAALILGDMLWVMGLQPQLGRSCAWSGGDDEVVMSQREWSRRGGGDVRGTLAILDHRQKTVIGVLPAEAAFPAPATDWWICQSAGARSSRTGDVVSVSVTYYNVVARLPGGATGTALSSVRQITGEARVDLGVVGGATRRAMRPVVVAGQLLAFMILIASTTAVALIAYARAAAATNQWRIHLWLGASRGRLAWLAGCDALLPLAVGTVIAALSSWATHGPIHAALQNATKLAVPAGFLDDVVVTATLAVTSAVVLGVGPVRLALRTSAQSNQRATARSLNSRQIGKMMGAHSLVASVFLLTAAGLVGGWWTVRFRDRGFHVADVAVASIDLSRLPTLTERAAKLTEVVDAANATPEFVAGAIDRLPLSSVGSTFDLKFSHADAGIRAFENSRPTRVSIVTPLALDALGASFVYGQSCSSAEAQTGESVVILNQAFVRRLGSSGSAPSNVAAMGQTFRVVGVVRDLLEDGVGSSPEPTAYICAGSQGLATGLHLSRALTTAELVVRQRAGGHVPPTRLRTISDDRSIVVTDVSSMSDRVSRAIGPLNSLGAAFAVMGGLSAAILLASGMALIHLLLTGQRRELGIRLAIGGSGLRTSTELLFHPLLWSFAGSVLGVLTGWLFYAALRNSVDGLRPLQAAVVPLIATATSLLAMAGGLPRLRQMITSSPKRLLDN